MSDAAAPDRAFGATDRAAVRKIPARYPEIGVAASLDCGSGRPAFRATAGDLGTRPASRGTRPRAVGAGRERPSPPGDAPATQDPYPRSRAEEIGEAVDDRSRGFSAIGRPQAVILAGRR